MLVLTSMGPFLFKRFIVPETELSLFLLIALYALITGPRASIGHGRSRMFRCNGWENGTACRVGQVTSRQLPAEN